MEIPNHSLPQITPEVLGKLNPDELLQLSVKLLKDLKELHDRLNQNSNNSSRPSSSVPPWEKDNNSNKIADEITKSKGTELEESQAEVKNKESDQDKSSNEMSVSHLNTNIKALAEFSSQKKRLKNLLLKNQGNKKVPLAMGALGIQKRQKKLSIAH